MLSQIHMLPLLFDMILAFKPCPDHCLCYESSDLVDCQSRGLTHIPHNIAHGTWLLDLSRNKLTEVRSNSFIGLWSLRILLLSNSSIRMLQQQSLSSLQFLERLDLSFNQLQWLPRDFSQSLSALQELRLDHNLLQHLSSPSLDHFENLRKLDVSYNHIRAMEGKVFNSLSHMNRLNLEGNRLNVLKDDLLTRQQNLEVLLLGHNNLSLIETEALAPLWSLTLLGLQGNQLVHLKFKTFLNLHTTSTHLQLSLNPWTCDCELHRVFSKIKHVRYLNVEDYDDIVCHAPALQAGINLSSMDSQLCITETASVLVITITVVLAVIGALIKAERNRKSKQAITDANSNRKL
ncbi:reticulon-4 receptor-like 2 [Lampris incognitus]|uniref:reticulon-4 receptor-like 2 n=1 Tax=Lampris incognitus TaxID=2546036 RepID=UPI0024B511EA|nr:reticulon-4 receptor-like 2 [Lampris incognitus]